MPETLTANEPAEFLESAPENPEAARVVRWVLTQLGIPRNLYRIDARKVWDGHYRVNVFCCDEDRARWNNARMRHSFFVSVTEALVAADPPIVREYDLPA